MPHNTMNTPQYTFNQYNMNSVQLNQDTQFDLSNLNELHNIKNLNTAQTNVTTNAIQLESLQQPISTTHHEISFTAQQPQFNTPQLSFTNTNFTQLLPNVDHYSYNTNLPNSSTNVPNANAIDMNWITSSGFIQQPPTTPLNQIGGVDMEDDDMLLTPLVSPAMNPFYEQHQRQQQFLANQMRMFSTNNDHFSPLTSPALTFAKDNNLPPFTTGLDQSISNSNINAQATSLPIPLSLPTPESGLIRSTGLANVTEAVVPPSQVRVKRATNKTRSKRTPKITPYKAQTEVNETNDKLLLPSLAPPATPSSLMKMPPNASNSKNNNATQPPSTGPSPSLKPLLPSGANQEIVQRLSSKSNYQNILEGQTGQLGLHYSPEVHSGIELRRFSHKAAEQKRRDVLKSCFEKLSSIIPGDTEKARSKVYLLRQSYDYIEYLKEHARSKDQIIKELKAKLGLDEDDPEFPIVPDTWRPSEQDSKAENDMKIDEDLKED